MMTPNMKEDICIRILESSRQLFLSARISEVCSEKRRTEPTGIRGRTFPGRA